MDHRAHTRRRLLRVAGGALATTVAGCLGDGGSGEQTVAMDDSFSFDPEAVSVEPGGTVAWLNESDVGHTVTAYADRVPDGAAYFASGGFETEAAARSNVSDGLVAPGESYEHTFEVAGTYEYYCIPHESSGMVGSVEVS